MRGTLSRSQNWDVMPDMFFYRDPEEAEKEAEAAAAAIAAAESHTDANAEAPAAGEEGTWAART